MTAMARAGERPKVSVCVITYNQRQYIHQCLQSILDQRTDFQFEVIVGDDCSTDGTKEIVAEFAAKYPGVVRPIFHDKNTGGARNFLDVHEAATGEYVAHIDGDDYALPGKLASQAKMLDENPAVALCAHAVRVEGEDRLIGADPTLPTLGSLNDLLRLGTYFANSSTMYRSKNAFPHARDLDIVDYYMHIEQASCGEIYLDKRPLGVYRWHPSGISKTEKQRERVERAYDLAFQRARDLGASEAVLIPARLKARRSSALRCLFAGNAFGFKSGLTLTWKELRYAGVRHASLFVLSRFVFGGVSANIARKALGKWLS